MNNAHKTAGRDGHGAVSRDGTGGEYAPLPATPDETQDGIDGDTGKSTTGKQAGGGTRHAIIATVHSSHDPEGGGLYEGRKQRRAEEGGGQGDR